MPAVSSSPVLSVIVSPSELRPRILEACLSRIARQDMACDRFEVIVIADSESSSDRNQKRNMGLRRARGEILYFLDDHCLLDRRDHLSLLVAFHEQHHDVALIGGGYTTPEGAGGGCRLYNNIITAWLMSQEVNLKGDIFLLGSNLSVKRSRLPVGARFDESIMDGLGELSFQQELFAAGEKSLLSRELDVNHSLPGAWSLLTLKAWSQGRGKLRRTKLQSLSGIGRLLLSFYREPKSLSEKAEVMAATPLYLGVAQLSWAIGEFGSRCGFSQRRKTLNLNA